MIINKNDSYQWVHLPPDHLYTVYCKVWQEWLQNAIAFGVMVAVCDSFFSYKVRQVFTKGKCYYRVRQKISWSETKTYGKPAAFN